MLRVRFFLSLFGFGFGLTTENGAWLIRSIRRAVHLPNTLIHFLINQRRRIGFVLSRAVLIYLWIFTRPLTLELRFAFCVILVHLTSPAQNICLLIPPPSARPSQPPPIHRNVFRCAARSAAGRSPRNGVRSNSRVHRQRMHAGRTSGAR